LLLGFLARYRLVVVLRKYRRMLMKKCQSSDLIFEAFEKTSSKVIDTFSLAFEKFDEIVRMHGQDLPMTRGAVA